MSYYINPQIYEKIPLQGLEGQVIGGFSRGKRSLIGRRNRGLGLWSLLRLEAGRHGRRLLSRGLLCRSVATLITTLIAALLLPAVLALAKELDRIGNNLRRVALVTCLVCPLAGAELSLHIYLGALVDEFIHHVGLAAPYHYIMPLGIFAQLAAAVTVAFCSSKAKGCHLCIVLGILGIVFEVTYFRVVSNVTD